MILAFDTYYFENKAKTACEKIKIMHGEYRIPTLLKELDRITKEKKQQLTHATSNLGIWLNGKIGLYLEDFANPKDKADLVPNCL